MYNLTVTALALDRFRRDFGVEANPEDAPADWDRYLAAAQNAVEEEEHG